MQINSSAISPNASAAAAIPTAGAPRDRQEPDAGGQTAVDFQNFLQLLTAQLRNQDPLSPLDSTEFVAQLASFSTVEQLVGANERLDAIAASILNDSFERYADWVGREAEISDGAIRLNGASIDFRINGDPQATRAEAVVTDFAGREAARFAIDPAPGRKTWDGTVNGAPVPSGDYTLSVTYFNTDNLLRSEAASSFAAIDGVRIGENGAELRTSDNRIIPVDRVVGLATLNGAPSE